MKPWLTFAATLFAASPLAMADNTPDNLFTVPLTAFKTSDANPAQKLYLKPGVNLKAYRAIQLEPLYFMRHDDKGNWELLQSSEQNRIAAYFQQKMTAELHKAGIAVTSNPGAGIARMRVAVTGLGQSRPGIDVVDILPIKAVFNLTRLAVGKEPYLMKVGSMAQLDDSQSGALLAGSVNMRESGKSTQKGEPMKLETIEGLIDDWCRDSAKLLAKALTVAQP
ncbi:DUF3313 domain-containing protein [Xenophilus sp. AP218F]|nr:DUF3313 domain-containing protein [Chromobacterium sp. ASV5]OWY38588.1 DUF3313 domain-containing protein [Xenophilus sp. AP218F]